MKIIAVDPDPVELIRLSESLRITMPVDTSVECFRDPLFVYQYARCTHVDAIYVVAEMKRLSGFNMAKQLRREDPKLRVYFIWDNDDYREDAIRVGADGYLVKPVTPDSIRRMEAELREEEEVDETDDD